MPIARSSAGGIAVSNAQVVGDETNSSSSEGGGAIVDVNLRFSNRLVSSYIVDNVQFNSASMREIGGIVNLPDGGLIASDSRNSLIFLRDESGNASVVAGNTVLQPGYSGDNLPASLVSLNGPEGLAYDNASGALFFCDSGNGRIRYFIPGGRIYTLAGGGENTADVVSDATTADIGRPVDLSIGKDGVIYFNDEESGDILKVGGDHSVTRLHLNNQGKISSIAASLGNSRIWYGIESKVFMSDLGNSTTTEILDFNNETVSSIAFDQDSVLYVTCVHPVGGNQYGSRIYQVPTDLSGKVRVSPGVTWIGGSADNESDNPIFDGTPKIATSIKFLNSGRDPISLDIEGYGANRRFTGKLFSAIRTNDRTTGIPLVEIVSLTPSLSVEQ